MDRRTFVTGTATAATAALAGCQNQNGDNEGNQGNTQNGEFTLNNFQLNGKPAEEYEANFEGETPEELLRQINPEQSYEIQGAAGEINTQTHFEYSDLTNPENSPLDQTVEGETHDENGQHTQTQGLPQKIDEQIFENPRNIQAEFTATDTETGQKQTKQYELNLADAYYEAGTRNIFENGTYATTDAKLEKVEVKNGKIRIKYESNNTKGSQEFTNTTSGV